MAENESGTGTKKATRPKRRPQEPPASVPAEVESVTDALPGPGVGAVAAEPGDGKQRKTISIPLKEDGTIDLEAMRDSTREKLTRALGASPLVNSFSVEDAGFIYDGLGGLESWAAVKFFGVEPELAKLFLYSQEEKAVLAEPTAKVLSKYLPAVGRFKDEATLILALYGIHQAKIMELQVIRAKMAGQPGTLHVAAAAGERTQ